MLATNPLLMETADKPSLENILSINAMDLETQDHILHFQLPVAVARYDVGLVVLDSITANYRAEHAADSLLALAARSSHLAKLGHLLRNLAAQDEGLAVVVANQVSDRFESFYPSRTPSSTRVSVARPAPAGDRLSITSHLLDTPPFPSSPAPSPPAYLDDDRFDGSYYLVGTDPQRNELLSLAHQQRFFTGWGDDDHDDHDHNGDGLGLARPSLPGRVSVRLSSAPKTPALGFVWSTQIACRIALKKEESQIIEPVPCLPQPTVESQDAKETRKESTPEPILVDTHIRRTMKVAVAPWTAVGEVDYEIWEGGLRHKAYMVER
ncbi:hypothetical protein ASPZODRAFT_1050427 [Penicilliopsis zonata CBS 506.65]|uniref:RecA family profile 1 domain-containing protein n=1 Tax=Penicilliopsis zonata CBS 506.65 TaxID=1073090 RepID=A0A1L9SRM3_9EURO|nr:hypothetical protein ASPZODRAFT_1050427 [Penicilliopsis zonata CBS 506.65]OJJ49865.1 hypothetical protein ASPZODRAFT_1050427 [Penicilliopsis zonata CBS 506.65]